MTATTCTDRGTLGSMAMRVRIALRLTQRELGDMAGVSKQDVYLFEHNLPVYLDARRKILKQLWSAKAARHENLLRSRQATDTIHHLVVN